MDWKKPAIIVLAAVGAFLVLCWFIGASDDPGAQEIEYNITMGDRYESDDGIEVASEGKQYAHVWIRHHNWTGEEIRISPERYYLVADGATYQRSAANHESPSSYTGYLENDYMRWFLVLFEVPADLTADKCVLEWGGSEGEPDIKRVSLDTIFDRDEDYQKGWNPIPDWPGEMTYSIELSSTFIGKDSWTEPGTGMTYAIVDYTIKNNNYSTSWQSGISNNCYNFLLDRNGIRYTYDWATFDVPGYASIEVAPGATYSGTVIFEVPRLSDAEDYTLIWDGDADMKITRQ